MIVIYNLSIALYSLSVRIASIFNHKARKFCKGRKDIFKKMQNVIEEEEGIIWIHAASLGEFEQGRPLIEAIKDKNPGSKILLTFFSPSGYEVRKNYMYADYIFYLPIDTQRNARRFMEIVQPAKAIFIKYEYWYHFLDELDRRNIPSYMVSAIFRPDQVFFKWYGSLHRKMVQKFTHFFVQNEQSKILLEQLEVTDVTIAGDTRFDRVNATAIDAPRNELIEAFKGDNNVLIAGSTWEPDEKLLLDYFSQMPDNWKLIIAPHEVHESHIQKIISKLSVPYIRYTQSNGLDVSNTRILIVDTIGILSSTYRYGEIAYIGGGFGVGIHNILEAATFGLPIVFGPNYHKFQEAKDLITKEAAKNIGNYKELDAYLTIIITDDQLRHNKGKAAKSYVKQNLGATSKILEIIGY